MLRGGGFTSTVYLQRVRYIRTWFQTDVQIYIYIDTDRTHAYPNRLEAMKRRRNTGINTHNEVETCRTSTVHISIAIPDGKREQTYLST